MKSKNNQNNFVNEDRLPIKDKHFVTAGSTGLSGTR